MALRNTLVRASRQQVWDVLADGWSYKDWVVGTAEIRQVDDGFPAVGTAIHYTTHGVGPARLQDRTVVRQCDPGRLLEMEAQASPFGSVRISIQLLDWGDDCVVIIDEHPLRGPTLLLDNPISETVLTLRNRRMLRHLAAVVEARSDRVTAGS